MQYDAQRKTMYSAYFYLCFFFLGYEIALFQSAEKKNPFTCTHTDTDTTSILTEIETEKKIFSYFSVEFILAIFSFFYSFLSSTYNSHTVHTDVGLFTSFIQLELFLFSH